MANPNNRASYNIDELRKRMKDKISSKAADPYEFIPPKAKEGEIIKYKFFLLPDLNKGDRVQGGLASQDMGGLFFLKDGVHWINKRPYACPRILQDEECELCSIGFELMKEVEDKKAKGVIARQWLSNTNYKVNIFFPDADPNPAAVRGKVLWFNGPKTCFDQWYGAFMRNDGGTEDDPEAHGVIYNPYEAYAYSLVIKKFGEYNDYKSSKFLANLGPQPIAMLSDKTPDEEAIQKILNMRHDLFTKIDAPNPAKIHEIAQSMLHGGDGSTKKSDDIPPTTPDDVAGEAPVAKKAAAPAPAAKKPVPAPAAKPVPPKPKPPVVEEPAPEEEPTETLTETEEVAEEVVEEVVEAPPPPPKPVAKPAAPKPAAPVAKAPVPAAKPAVKPPVAKPKPVEDDLGGDDDDDAVQALIKKMKSGGNDD